MKKILLSIALIIIVHTTFAQWSTSNQLSDINTWSSQPGFISWYNTPSNAPNNQYYGTGIQSILTSDTRFGTQLVIPTFDSQIYYRNMRNGNWDPWYKVWSSVNFDPDSYLDRSVPTINNAGSSNSFINGYTFAYATSGTPWNGSLISYGGFGGSYDTQINSDYGPNGGKHISFRTMNGDNNNWNNWYEIYHSGNINRTDVDFAAQTINCTNVYSNGNVWAKQIKVALANPWPDYVFKASYALPTLQSVKSYIDLNHHLPDMPTEAEVAKNGLNLGEANTLLTKKIEELTLYLIDKDKQLTEQQKQIEQQQANHKQDEARIAKLEAALAKLATKVN